MNPLNIFIVDDDRDFAESVADVFEARGHQCEIALNGVESFFEIRKMRRDGTVDAPSAKWF